MAQVNTKAAAVSSADAKPNNTAVNNKLTNARVKEAVGVVEAVSGDSIGSTYRLARIHSSWRVSQVLISCDAITTCAADVGLCDVADVNSGAAVDADFFASAQSLAAALVHQDVTHEADAADVGAGFGLADVEKPLWQALGLTADPGKWYDVTATLTAAAGSAGTVVGKVRYVDGN